jgi:pimeloyl-ACP methyl ester carboxylesterase
MSGVHPVTAAMLAARMKVSSRKLILGLQAGVGIPLPKIAVELFWPGNLRLARTPKMLACLPGGGMNRRYFDIGGDDLGRFSFARHMAAEGYVVACVDHLGVGESTRPADGFILTPNLLAAANSDVTRQLASGLRNGSLVPELPSLPDLQTIGVGHSMGAMLTVLQQAGDPTHAGLVLLGFSNRGLPDYLPTQARALIGAPDTIADRIAGIARQLHATPYGDLQPSPGSSTMFHGAKAERVAVEALKLARDKLLVVAGLQSIIPEGLTPQLATIDTPVFLAVGDHDIAGPPHAIPASFPASRDISLLILKDTGHAHFIFPSRCTLFRKIADWIATLAA